VANLIGRIPELNGALATGLRGNCLTSRAGEEKIKCVQLLGG